jgi:hypothetical protein
VILVGESNTASLLDSERAGEEGGSVVERLTAVVVGLRPGPAANLLTLGSARAPGVTAAKLPATTSTSTSTSALPPSPKHHQQLQSCQGRDLFAHVETQTDSADVHRRQGACRTGASTGPPRPESVSPLSTLAARRRGMLPSSSADPSPLMLQSSTKASQKLKVGSPRDSSSRRPRLRLSHDACLPSPCRRSCPTSPSRSRRSRKRSRPRRLSARRTTVMTMTSPKRKRRTTCRYV